MEHLFGEKLIVILRSFVNVTQVELKRGAFIRGKVEACDLHLHNVKTIELADVEGKNLK